MKRLFWITCAILMLGSVNTFSQDVNKGEKQNQPSHQKAMGIHPLELKADVDKKEFEEFITKKLIPLYQAVDGQDMKLMLGDRGVRNGKYSLLIIFNSVKARDRIYPPEGGISEEFSKILEGTDKIWEQLQAYVEGDPFGNHTDYLVVKSQ